MAGLFFKKNRIVSRIIHLLATFYLKVLNLKASLKLKPCLKAVEGKTLKRMLLVSIRKHKLTFPRFFF